MTPSYSLRNALVCLALASLTIAGLGCQQRDDAKIVRMAYVAGPSELASQAAERFADLVADKSGGALQVRIYPAGQLGDEREIIEGLQLRSVDYVVTGCAIIGWYAPPYGLFEAPFLWRDYDHVEHVWQGPVGQELRKTMHDALGVDMRTLWYRGPRYLTTTSKPIRTPEDLQGLKLRVPELEVYVKSWQAFGANTTPLPFNDMFMALKLGVVDGQENPLATVYGNNLHEVQKYVMNTQHLIGFYIVSTGPWFEKRFTEQERQWLDAALQEATAWHNSELARSEQQLKKTLLDSGVEFVEVDRAAFQTLAREKASVLFENIWKPGLYRQITETP